MTDAIIALEGIISKLPAAIERRRIGESLGRTTEALQGADRQLRRLTALIDFSAHTTSGQTPGEVDPIKGLVETARSLAQLMLKADSAEQLRDVKESYTEFLKDLARAQQNVRGQWAKIVDRDFRPLQAVGDLLQKMGTSAELGQRLRECGQDAVRSLQVTDIELLRETGIALIRQRASLEVERTSMASDPDIDRFLSAMANGRAPLEFVTARVHSWLEGQAALANFMVIPKQ